MRHEIGDMANNMQIIPTITTITPGKWREKLAEVKKFRLKEIAVFPTCLDAQQRKELFSLLETTEVERIPFVHIRNDMEIWELDYLVKRFKTKVFSTHTEREYIPLYGYGKHKKAVFIENTHNSFDEEEIKRFGGICLDLSHLENDRLLHPETYQHNAQVLKKYPPRCSHVAVAKSKPFLEENGYQRCDTHTLTELRELDYLKRYPLEYFGEFLAIELENSIEEQLKAKEYIGTLINKK